MRQAMLIRGTYWRTRVRQSVTFVGVIFGVSLCALYLVRKPSFAFWDAHIYGQALQNWAKGLDPYVSPGPYVQGKSLLFVGPPVFLYLMSGLRHIFPGSFGFDLYLALAVFSTFAIPPLIAHFYLRGSWLSAPLALAIFSASYGTWALLTGNITNVLYAAALSAGIAGVRRNQWIPFLAVVALAGLLKPQFMALVLLPLLAGQGQLLAVASSIIVCLSGYALQWHFAPRLSREFQQSVNTQVIVHRDVGFGLFLHLLRPGKPPLIHGLSPTVINALLIAPVFLLLLGLRIRRQEVLASTFWMPCLLTFSILCNPRLQTYDADVAMVPAVYIAVEFFRTLPIGWWRSFWIGLVIISLIEVNPARREIGTLATLILSVCLAIYRLILPVSEVEALLPFPSGRDQQALKAG